MHHSIVSFSLMVLLHLLSTTMTHISYGQALVEESIWQSLEDDIIPSLNSGKSNWLELQSKLLPKKYKESNVCVAGGMQVVVSCIYCLPESHAILFTVVLI